MGRVPGTTAIAAALALLVSLTLSGAASAQGTEAQEAPPPDPRFQPILQLNEEARQAFASYSYRSSQGKLDEALELATQLGLAQKPELAPTNLLAGITAISGFNDLYRGLHFFVAAIRLDPKVQVPKALATPQLVQMFTKAQEAVKEVGKPPTILLGTEEGLTETGEAATQPAALGLIHVPVDSAKRGFPVPLKAQAGIDVQAHKVFMYYRSQGEVKFDRLPMQRSKGVFRANIPPTATQGRYLHYYIEALDQRGRRSASNGSARSPNVVIIKLNE